MKKRIICIALALTLSLSIMACGDKKVSQESKEVSSAYGGTESESKSENGNKKESKKDSSGTKKGLKDYEAVALKFVEDLMANDIDSAYASCDIRCPEFVNKDDLVKGLDKTNFRRVVNEPQDAKVTDSSASDNGATVSVMLEDDFTLDITLVKAENGSYLVDLGPNEVYITNFVFTAPENFKVTIDGVDISKYYTRTDKNGYAVYTIDQFGLCDKTASASTPTYGEYSVTFEPYYEYTYYYKFYAENPYTEVIRADIKNLLSEMISVCNSTNGDVSAMERFVSSSAKYDASTIVSECMGSIYKNGYTNIVVDDVVLDVKSPVSSHRAPSLFIVDPTTETFRVNLGLMLHYTDKDGEHENNRRGSIGVRYEDGVLKITDTDNPRIFYLDYTNGNDFSSPENY